MDIDALRNSAALVSTLIAIGTAAYAWFTSRSKINEAEIRALQATVGQLQTQLQLVENKLQQMPNKDTVHALDLKVTELNGIVNVVAESLQSVERTAHRIENFLLDQAKPK
jgi:archaellum component FlaF (FlaF/FlaG flagellin family)